MKQTLALIEFLEALTRFYRLLDYPFNGSIVRPSK